MSECELHCAKPGDEQFHFGFYVVALIDFLGQSRELERWEARPTDDHYDEWVAAVQNSMGKAMLWRDEFTKRFERWEASSRLAARELPAAPTEKLEQFKEFREARRCSVCVARCFLGPSPAEHRSGAHSRLACCLTFLRVRSLRACVGKCSSLGEQTLWLPADIGWPRVALVPGACRAESRTGLRRTNESRDGCHLSPVHRERL